jgi:hypothetical protein
MFEKRLGRNGSCHSEATTRGRGVQGAASHFTKHDNPRFLAVLAKPKTAVTVSGERTQYRTRDDAEKHADINR